jgi:hypothetical protein
MRGAAVADPWPRWRRQLPTRTAAQPPVGGRTSLSPRSRRPWVGPSATGAVPLPAPSLACHWLRVSGSRAREHCRTLVERAARAPPPLSASFRAAASFRFAHPLRRARSHVVMLSLVEGGAADGEAGNRKDERERPPRRAAVAGKGVRPLLASSALACISRPRTQQGPAPGATAAASCNCPPGGHFAPAPRLSPLANLPSRCYHILPTVCQYGEHEIVNYIHRRVTDPRRPATRPAPAAAAAPSRPGLALSGGVPPPSSPPRAVKPPPRSGAAVTMGGANGGAERGGRVT